MWPPVAAVYSAFGPDDRLVASVARAVRQFAQVVVVNDAPAEAGSARLARAAALGAVVLHDAENLGLAAALNRGVRVALAGGARWIATFDQDSIPPDGFVEGLLGALAGDPRAARVGILAPALAGERGRPAGAPHRVPTVITSGSLIRAEVLVEVGLLDEALFIDYVDHDFCLRVGRAGWDVVRVPGTVLDHRLGAPREHRVLGLALRSTHHSARRRYCSVRNRVVVYRRHALFAPAWAARDLGQLGKELAKLVLVEEDRWPKLRAVARGLWDGLAGRLGPPPP